MSYVIGAIAGALLTTLAFLYAISRWVTKTF
jgi:heme/copper-type cytochrome/quinol oxidase subunit 4